MKKRLFIALLVAIVACLFALSVSAANEVTLTSGETVDFETVFKISSINWKGLDGVTTKVDNVVTGYNTGYTKNDIVHVTFPDEINGIESNFLFSSSTSIRTITFAATDTFFMSGDNMFSSCSVTKVTFNPNCVVDFRKGNFSECTSLTQITFPKFISLAGSAFKGCSNMVATNDLVFAEGMKEIGGHAFNGCSKLRGTVYFPASLETIQEYSFQNSGFDYFDLSKCSSLTVVGGGYGGPFTDCNNITKLDMSGCTSLTELKKGNLASSCDNLVEVILPPNLTNISHKSFAHCYKLQSIVLPASMQTVADEAFHSARSGQTIKTFTFYIQSNVVFHDPYAWRDSGAKIEFVLLNGVTVESFKAVNTHAAITGATTVDYLDPASKWQHTAGGALTNHTIVINYCNSLALTKSHSATDTICGNDDYCTDCGYHTLTPHVGEPSVTYPNGYTKSGLAQTCHLAACNGNIKTTLKPIFETVGYSVKEKGGYGIVSTFYVNPSALKAYEDMNGKLTIGIIVANAKTIGQDAFMTKGDDGKYKLNATKGIQVEMSDVYSRIDATLDQFTQDAVDLNLVIALYVIDENGVSFVQHEGTYAGEVTKGESTLDIVTISKIAELTNVTLPFVVPTPSGNEENE